MAARLKQLGVPTLIIDRNERIGDNWRHRYHQLVLHDAVWYVQNTSMYKLNGPCDSNSVEAVALTLSATYFFFTCGDRCLSSPS